MTLDTVTLPGLPLSAKPITSTHCSAEFFHIYSDEMIGNSQLATLEKLRDLTKQMAGDLRPIILIDNYNSTEHILAPEMVFSFLKENDALPYYWAYEADMIKNADILLENVNSQKIKNNYLDYIKKHSKYPCSLLTASWYLTRLGYLDHTGIIHELRDESFEPATSLVNILPETYQSVEKRCLELIANSAFTAAVDDIHDVFIPVASHNKTSL